MIENINNYFLEVRFIPFLQILLLLILILLILTIKRFRASIKKENRIKDFSIARYNNIGITNYWRVSYIKFVHYLSFSFRNSVFLNKYAKYYDIYVGVVNTSYKSGLEFVISELLFSILVFFGVLLLLIFNGYVLTPFGIIVLLGVSYIFIYFKHYKKFNDYRKEIKKDFYDFMTILLALLKDNSFNQSLDIVLSKTNGSVNKELSKMKNDLEYGLSIHDAFVRCYERTRINEFNIVAEYIYVIPNIGGNIADSFALSYTTLLEKSKIERKIFNNTLGISVFLIFLSLIPFLTFISFIFFKHEYLLFLLHTIIGRLIILIIIILYFVYILSVRFIMRESVRL